MEDISMSMKDYGIVGASLRCGCKYLLDTRSQEGEWLKCNSCTKKDRIAIIIGTVVLIALIVTDIVLALHRYNN